jgi:hypothetical protein
VIRKVATPDELRFSVPIKAPPLKKLTLPRGEPVGVGVTVAVRVTDSPAVAGLGAPERVIVVAEMALFTVSATAFEVDLAKPAFPI